MTKILVTDFYGTLISGDPSGMEYFYSRGNHLRDILELYNDKEYYNNLMDRAFIQLGRPLNDFLSAGNYLKLVTSMDSHDSVSFIFVELLSRFYEVIKDYRNQVSVFLTSGSGNKTDFDLLSKVAKISQIDDYFYAENTNGVSAYIISDKTKVFDFVSKEHNLELDELFTIGDSSIDIPMLFRCIELGGKSSLINNYLYRADTGEDFTTDSIVKGIVSLNFKIMIEELAYKMYPDFKNYDRLRQLEIIEELEENIIKNNQYNEWCYAEYNKVYNYLRTGELDLNNLIKKQMIFRVISEYNRKIGLPYFENHRAIESKRVEDLSMYATFSDYCDKVLKKINN